MKYALIVFFAPMFALANDGDVNLNAVMDQIFLNISENKPVGYAAGAILVLVFLFRKYIMPKTRFNAGVLPWLSILLGFLIGFLGMLSGGVPLVEAVNVMLISGPGASAMWASVFKLMSKKD